MQCPGARPRGILFSTHGRISVPWRHPEWHWTCAWAMPPWAALELDAKRIGHVAVLAFRGRRLPDAHGDHCLPADE
jgi:hypothetical protein